MSEISLRNCAITQSSQRLTDSFRIYMDLEGYFCLGDRTAHPILFQHGKSVVVDTGQIAITSPWYVSALKVLSYFTLIIPLIVAVILLIGRFTLSVRTHLDILILRDSVQCLQKLNEQQNNLKCLGISPAQWEDAICDWNPDVKTEEQQAAFNDCVHFLISHGVIAAEPLFKKAVNSNKSPACVQLLLEKANINSQTRSECLQEAVRCNHADIAYLLCNKDAKRLAELFFDQCRDSNDAEMRHRWTTLFRFNQLNVINSMVDPFISCVSTNKQEQVRKTLQEVKADCMQWMPHVAQYDKKSRLDVIACSYQRSDNESLSIVGKDQVYGHRCRNLVLEFLDKYTENSRLEPQAPQFRQLPTGSNGERTAAHFLEMVCNFRDKARQGDNVQLRNAQTTVWTPIGGSRYSWGDTLLSNGLSSNNYKGLEVSSKQWSLWRHGCTPPLFTWPDIEDAFQQVMIIDPNQDNQRFYQSLIKLVWLIGNSTPLTRGTGTVVESVFALAHLKWGVQPPILKKASPQFDVINISVTLEDYQKNWNRYFEPSTLIPAVRP